MVSRKVMIMNPSGIHARPASVLVKIVSACKSDVYLVIDDKKIIAKSVLNIMAAAIKEGTEVEVQCDGEDEAEDLERVIAAIESGLGE